MTTGELIHQLRKQRGLSQRDLANILGISPVNISQLENDKREPRLETLLKLADALGCKVDDLTSADAMKVQAPAAEYAVQRKRKFSELNELLLELLGDSGPGAVQLIQTYYNLTSDGKAELLKRADELTRLARYDEQYQEYLANSWKDHT